MNIIDKTIAFFAPGAGVKRAQHRMFLEQLGQRAFDAASKGRRTKDWWAPSTSAPAEINRALTELRNRSRDMVRNNPYSARAVKKIANNVIGMGIVPTPKKLSKPQEKKIKDAWKLWANNSACDFDGHLNFSGIQKLAMLTVAESGECIIRKRIVNDKSLPFALQLQVLEGDFVDTRKHGGLDGGGFIMYGIEFNKLGKVVAYWLYENHPGNELVINNNNFNSNRYPAEEIIHIFEKTRPGQYRGIPFGVSSMIRLRDLSQYQDAALVRQKMAQCYTAFITDQSGLTAMPFAGKNDETDVPSTFEPGMIEMLPPGKQITFANPPGTEGYGEYTKTVLREIAAGYDMDYPNLSGDLSAVNFSSGRLGRIDFNLTIQDLQWNMLIPMMCEKVWTWFVQMAAVYGYTKADTVIDVEWTTPRREMVNPEAETKAIIDSVQAGLTSWTDAVTEAGYNPEDQIEKMKNDKAAFEAAGLPNYADKAEMTAKPAPANNNQKDDKSSE